MLDRTSDAPTQIDASAPRKAIERIEKRARLYAARIDEIASELRAIVDGLGAGILTVTPHTSAVNDIIECVANHTGIGPNAIRSTRQDKTTVRARHIAFYIASELTSLSLPKLGNYFGRDHTSILHGVRKVRRLMMTDAELTKDIETITAAIRGRA